MQAFYTRIHRDQKKDELQLNAKNCNGTMTTLARYVFIHYMYV